MNPGCGKLEKEKMEKQLESDAIKVVTYDPSRLEDWEKYVNSSPVTVFSHHIGWKYVVEETYGHKAVYLMAYRLGQVAGVLPLFLVRSKLFGRFLVSSPYLTFGGIACEDETVSAALVDGAIRIGRDLQVHYVEIRNERPCRSLPYTNSKYYTLILDLSMGEDKIWNSHLHPTVRRNVRKAKQAGLKIVEGESYLDEFVAINRKNMQRLGTPAHGRLFFHNIKKFFPDSILLMVCSEGTCIGGTLLIRFKDTILMPWIASLSEYFTMRPNNLLYWEAVSHACQEGFRYLDFGRSKWDSGTFKFKAQYGAKPVQLGYQFYLHKAKEVPDIDPDSPKFKMLVAIWRKLPLSIVNRLGPHIIRCIP